MIYIGIDPGKQGGAAALNADGTVRSVMSFTTATEQEIARKLMTWGKHQGGVRCVLEKVHSMPRQGVRSMFTFGQGYGFLRGVLFSQNIPFNDVNPQAWMKAIGCMTGGDKKVSRGKAQQLFPEVKVTNAIADALLIAYYARTFLERK